MDLGSVLGQPMENTLILRDLSFQLPKKMKLLSKSLDLNQKAAKKQNNLYTRSSLHMKLLYGTTSIYLYLPKELDLNVILTL